MHKSPLKGTGHNGSKSPRKIDRVKLLDFAVAKIKSPVKRSISELNKIAYNSAVQNLRNLSETDDNNHNDQYIMQKIIELSKTDGYSTPLYFEEEEKDDSEIVPKLEKIAVLKTDNIFNNHTNQSLRKVSEIEFPRNETEISPLKVLNQDSPAITPSSSPSKISPTKHESDNQSLRRSTRKRVSVLDKLQSVSNELSPSLSPRKRTKRNLHDSFNITNDITPKLHKDIKLMKVPEIDADNDPLLSKDSNDRNKSSYQDGFEAYFEQNQTKSRLSKSSMTMAPDLSYDEFNRYNKLQDLICPKLIKSLNKLYEFQFMQWYFELQEGFNLIFYGVGSKRQLLINFLQTFILPLEKKSKCIVVNGYNTELNFRMLVKEIWKVCFKQPVVKSREIRETCDLTYAEFSRAKYSKLKLYILLNNIDGESLRNDDLQYLLSQIAKIQNISLICSTDNVNTPIFWDAAVLSNFNFMWHNVTTYKSYQTEVSFKDPLSIGKTDEIIGSKGAKYVLSSLTGNAKSLYKNLILQQLEKIDLYIGEDTKLLNNRGIIKGSFKTSIPLREFYELCVGEFIISNDISFRTILGEFVEHKMCNLVRDTAGTEILCISFTVDEMEKLLDEELMD